MLWLCRKTLSGFVGLANYIRAVERELRFAAWFRSTPSSAMVWSPGLYETLGIHPSVPATNDLYLKAIHPDDRLIASASALPGLVGKTVTEHVFRVIKPDGSMRAVRNIVHELADQDEAYTQVGLLFDETEGPNHRSLATDILRRLGFLNERRRATKVPMKSSTSNPLSLWKLRLSAQLAGSSIGALTTLPKWRVYRFRQFDARKV